MKSYRVSLSPDAIADLTEIYDYIADASGYPETVWNYIQMLEAQCYTLETAPMRGRNRDDLWPGLRVLALDKRAVAAFEIDEAARAVRVLNIFYGGRDYEVLIGG